MQNRFLALCLLLIPVSIGVEAQAARYSYIPEFPSCAPASELSADSYSPLPNTVEPPSLNFCAEWNPEFPFNGHHCCGKDVRRGNVVKRRRGRRRGGGFCFNQRRKSEFCDEVSPSQWSYIEGAGGGKLGDILGLLTEELGRKGDQAYCTVNNGFLARGRPIVSTARNRLKILNPKRCAYFGTDNMAGMLEWLGRQVADRFPAATHPGVFLSVGDVAAPKGGCLAGRSGHRGHASHTNGTDADIGFLLSYPRAQTPDMFHQTFDPKTSWWFVKRVFENPFACVKVIFLDKRLIRKLSIAARGDEDWRKLHRFIRHMPGHRNHMHIRIGRFPGQPGCVSDARPEEEAGDDWDDASDGEETEM